MAIQMPRRIAQLFRAGYQPADARGEIGLGNVDNTSDAAKPISTAAQSALDGKLATNGNGSGLTGITAGQVSGLGTAATTAATAYATAAQGAKADSAVQPAVLAAYAPLASPAFTGTPTAPNQAAGNNSTRVATTAYVDSAVAAVVSAAPGALDTLDELAAALGDDPNFAATVATNLAGKASRSANLSDLADAATARNNLGLGTAATANATAFAAASHTHPVGDITGTLPVGKGGTGLATIAAGRLLYASAADTLAPLTLGTGLSITGGTLNAAAGGGSGTIATTAAILKGDNAGNAVAAVAGTDYPGLAAANTFAAQQTHSAGTRYSADVYVQKTADASFYVVAGGATFEFRVANGLHMDSDLSLRWVANKTNNSAWDTGLSRASAAVVRVTDGGSGYGDIKTRAAFVRKNAAPADSELVVGEAAIWFDSTTGAAKLMVKAKNAAGTVVTGSINLT